MKFSNVTFLYLFQMPEKKINIKNSNLETFYTVLGSEQQSIILDFAGIIFMVRK